MAYHIIELCGVVSSFREIEYLEVPRMLRSEKSCNVVNIIPPRRFGSLGRIAHR
jgi:hypothetical protein